MFLFKTRKSNTFALVLKKAISIVFVFLLVFSNLSRIWILIDFKVNQDFIAKVLCINKDKPELQCNGKCHLASQIKDQEEKENQGTSSETNIKTEVIYFSIYNAELPSQEEQPVLTKEKSPFYNCLRSSDFLDRLLRPPQLA